MAENTKIEWADHTFNPWEGCTKVGPGCDNCYAENRNARFAGGAAINWGPGPPRRRTSPANWRKPLAWDKAHADFFARHGRRQRVFCASLADVFDYEVDPRWRSDLFALIGATPNLDWLLLTKRIGNVRSMVPAAWLVPGNWPKHVRIGITIVNQPEADRDIAKLLALPCPNFLSVEPLLGPVEIAKWLDPWTCSNCSYHGSENDSGPARCDDCDLETQYDANVGSQRCPKCQGSESSSDRIGATCPRCERNEDWSPDYGFIFDSERLNIDWVIVGGESGPKARPMHPDWVRSLRDQCVAAGVAFHFKQWGEYWEVDSDARDEDGGHVRVDVGSRYANDVWDDKTDCLIAHDGRLFTPDSLPEDTPARLMTRLGKKAAGRLLDGRTWDEVPA